MGQEALQFKISTIPFRLVLGPTLKMYACVGILLLRIGISLRITLFVLQLFTILVESTRVTGEDAPGVASVLDCLRRSTQSWHGTKAVKVTNLLITFWATRIRQSAGMDIACAFLQLVIAICCAGNGLGKGC